MTEPRGGGRGGGFAQSMAFSAARGGGLIALAIVIGLVLLQVVDSSGGGASAEGISTTTTAPPTTTTPEDTTPEETTPPDTRPPSEIRVKVLNGVDPTQALAGPLSEELRVAGYQTVAPADTATRQGTVVFCKAEFANDAPALALAVGEDVVVEPFPEPPPEGADNVAEYDCLVVIGS